MKPNQKPRPTVPHPSAAGLPRTLGAGAIIQARLLQHVQGGDVADHIRRLFPGNIALQTAVGAIVLDAEPGSLTVGNAPMQQLLAAIEAEAVLPRVARRVPANTVLGGSDVDAEADEALYLDEDGMPIPLTAPALGTYLLQFRPLAALIAFSEELAKRGDAAAFFGKRVLRALVRGWNAAAFSLTGSASLLATAIEVPSSGTDAEAINTDLATAVGSLSGTLAGVALVCSPRTAAYLALLRDTAGAAAFPGVTVKGGTLAGFTLLAGIGVPDSVLVAVDGASVLYDVDVPEIALGRNALLEFSNTPAMNSATPAALALAQAPVSLFQAHSVAVRGTLPVVWQQLQQSGSVAVITGFPQLPQQSA